jgi:iron(III) transport system ATP-binding protein
MPGRSKTQLLTWHSAHRHGTQTNSLDNGDGAGEGLLASVDLLGIRKSYGSLVVADGIDLAIAHEELVCLLGPSGCGKTTTLRLIAGFIVPDEGTIRVGDRVLSSPGATLPPERRNMSMIFQSYALWPHMTVAENIAYGLTLRRMPRAEIARKVDRILDIAKLTPLKDRSPGALSGGQQQRVALARALVVEPETLLLDEPLSNLDTNLREEMRFEIRRLHDEFRYTTVYVTHDQSEAMTTADKIVVMNRGRIEQIGSPETIYQHPCSEFVARFIGGTNILRGQGDGDAVRCGPMVIRCGNAVPKVAGETPVSIRPMDVELHSVAAAPGAAAALGVNEFVGTVLRHTYLGPQRDYLLEMPGGQQIRATTPLRMVAAVGSQVGVRLPPEQCRALAL